MSKPKAFEAFQQRGIFPRGDKWDAVCPAHEDKRKSLVLAIGDNGSVVLTCHAGCSVRTIVEALGLKMTDLWPKVASSKKWCAPQERVIASYDYEDERGAILYQVQRMEPKAFRQRRPVEDARDRGYVWEWKLGDVRRVLYGLPLLVAQPSRPCFIVEGEKDVHSLRKLGFLATTCAGGAGGWRKEYAEQIGNREVIVLPDNDDPGRQFAANIRATIPRALVVNLPVAEKGDVTDWIAASPRTGAGLAAIVENAAWQGVESAKKTLDALTDMF